jgi:hypothetical protein
MGERRRRPGKVRMRRDYADRRLAYTTLYLPGPDEAEGG